MKKLMLVLAVIAPMSAFAQTADNHQVTRAEVKAQLVQLEKAGYNPNDDRINYPQDIQAAEARVANQNAN